MTTHLFATVLGAGLFKDGDNTSLCSVLGAGLFKDGDNTSLFYSLGGGGGGGMVRDGDYAGLSSTLVPSRGICLVAVPSHCCSLGGFV